ncbi:MAG: amidinotransferase [Saprospiraceae bacterium]|nr:amidinotransferase [Saprospiraceae bacterium]
MERQLTDTIMMIRPSNFGYNQETAEDNAFQSNDGAESVEEIVEIAKDEFDRFVDTLLNEGVRVHVIEDTPVPVKNDSVFPNNWISFHENGWVITYPMFSEMRRLERREDIVEDMMAHFQFNRRYSFEHYEENELFLEGTGSLVLDRTHKIAYASLSVRTDVTILDKWAVLTGYRTQIFHGTDKTDQPIYHTNVLMAMGDEFVVICLDTIKDDEERNNIMDSFARTGKEVIHISYDQMEAYAGNMLQLNTPGGSIIVMSTQAYNSLTDDQIIKISQYSKIVHSNIPVIEKYGGGSVRCMMAEVFYPVS